MIKLLCNKNLTIFVVKIYSFINNYRKTNQKEKKW